MNTYTFTLNLQVQVQAYDQVDAQEAVEDVYGPGTAAGIDVTEFRVVKIVEH